MECSKKHLCGSFHRLTGIRWWCHDWVWRGGDPWQARRFTRKDGKMFNTLWNTRPDITTRIAFCFPSASQNTPQFCRKGTGQSLDCYGEWQLHFISPLYPTRYSLRECCDKDDHAVHQRKVKGTSCRNCHSGDSVHHRCHKQQSETCDILSDVTLTT